MTTPPLPDIPCVRCRVIGTDNAGNDWGTRFFLSYSGSAPSGANCITLANDILAAYGTDLAAAAPVGVTVTEVDVIDIATASGLSGQSTGTQPGTRTGTVLPIQCAMGIEYGIARRYRGGKPRSYWPFGVEADLHDQATWGSTFVGSVNTSIVNFFTALQALSVGSMGTLTHVSLSYYHSFTPIKDSSGRYHNVPNYKATATHDDITGYFAKAEINSQKRRRTATTP